MNPPPFAVHANAPLLDPQLRTLLASTPTSHLSDNLARMQGCVGLAPVHIRARMVGSALTVRSRPGDNLLVYRALELIEPGHVLVLDGGGEITNALVGELIMQLAIARSCVGFVVDGAVRDSAAFRAADFPCFARGISHRGPYKLGPGEVNVPVSIGGQVVRPGDVVVADEDGIVTFPAERAAELIEAAQTTARNEAAIQQQIASGAWPQPWIRKVLEPHGL